MSNPNEEDYDDYPDEEGFVPPGEGDPENDDDPPYFPKADPDAPAMPDWDGVEPEGEQMPDAGAGEE